MICELASSDKMRKTIFIFILNVILFGYNQAQSDSSTLKLNDLGYFETRGVNVFVFSNWYDGNFSDAKMSGIEIIHHGVRTATKKPAANSAGAA
jgi:hypothetical protein